MKKTLKQAGGILAIAAFSFGIFALSCKVNKGSANVAFAEESPAATIPQDSLAVTQALQSTFRGISSSVLPAVVEVDVTETKKVSANPFPFDIPEWFFGIPRGNRGEDGTIEQEQKGLGSGVIVRRTGKTNYVLTNNHVAGNATKITIKLNDKREFEGKLVGADARIDIALVSFESDDTTIAVAKLGDSDTMQQGDIVLALGSPLGYFASVTQGIVSATGRTEHTVESLSDFIQTDAAINQGNSGGPLVNIYGEVIGINTWIVSTGGGNGGSIGLGFAIPINNVKNAIDQFIDNGKITYGWLGVLLTTPEGEIRKEMGLAEKQDGALALTVTIGSPAFKSGLLPGDWIIEFNGSPIKGSEQLVREIGKIPAGQEVELTVLRGKERKTFKAKLEERTEEAVSDSSKYWPGFSVVPLSKEIRKELKIDDKKVEGVCVASVEEKTPAAALRLQKGDIITAINDKSVKNLEEFYRELNIEDKKEIWFDIYSEGHTITTSHYKLPKK